MISYMEWLNEAEQLVHEGHDDELKQLLCQIMWVQNLTNTTQAQDIFEAWYKEMITETQYEILIQVEGE